MLSYIDNIGIEEEQFFNDHLIDRYTGYYAVIGAYYNASIQEINQLVISLLFYQWK